MFVAYVVLAVVLALSLLASASLKLRRDRRAIDAIHGTVGVPMSWFPYLAACEVAGAIGVLVGIFWVPIGVVAAACVIAYMVGAVIGHLRVHDTKGLASPIVPLVLAIAALVTRVLSA